MSISAITKLVNFGDSFRVEITLPKYGNRPLFVIDKKYNGRPVKLVGGLTDIPSADVIFVNDGPVEVSKLIHLTTGMIVTLENDNNVYIIAPRSFLL